MGIAGVDRQSNFGGIITLKPNLNDPSRFDNSLQLERMNTITDSSIFKKKDKSEIGRYLEESLGQGQACLTEDELQQT